MTEDTAVQPPIPEKEGKIPVGFWWILTGTILLIGGAAIAITVLPGIMDGRVRIPPPMIRPNSPFKYIPHNFFAVTGPLLPGIFAIAYGINLRRKAGLSYIPFFFSGIATDEEKK